MDADPPAAAPSRVVHVGDGVAWLAAAQLPPTHAVFTSLPDVSECAGLPFDAWCEWFVATAAVVCAQVASEAPAIFYQTDIRRDGRWVDKGHLVARGADRAGAACLFHKVICRAPAGTVTAGRPGYAHVIAFSRELRGMSGDGSADVLPRLGTMTWPRAMGTDACEAVCTFLRRSTSCTTLVDPFCGHGTALAVANAHGFDAVGVERSAKRARRARELRYVRGAGAV